MVFAESSLVESTTPYTAWVSILARVVRAFGIKLGAAFLLGPPLVLFSPLFWGGFPY